MTDINIGQKYPGNLQECHYYPYTTSTAIQGIYIDFNETQSKIFALDQKNIVIACQDWDDYWGNEGDYTELGNQLESLGFERFTF